MDETAHGRHRLAELQAELNRLRNLRRMRAGSLDNGGFVNKVIEEMDEKMSILEREIASLSSQSAKQAQTPEANQRGSK